ncbi:hypothetical protein SESBI_20610 [Sesbania bispinosa]|nr:hypothetical protein SESBI_20610 [Sesbania bispinosa]
MTAPPFFLSLVLSLFGSVVDSVGLGAVMGVWTAAIPAWPGDGRHGRRRDGGGCEQWLTVVRRRGRAAAREGQQPPFLSFSP